MFNFQHKYFFQHTNIIHNPWITWRRKGKCLYIKQKTKNQLDNGRLEIWCVFHLSLELTRDSWTNTFKIMVQPLRINMYVLDSNHMVNTDSCFPFSTHYDNESPLVCLFIFLCKSTLESLNSFFFFLLGRVLNIYIYIYIYIYISFSWVASW
jgi:hypothetical protein